MEQQIREIKDQRSKVIVAGKENGKIVFCAHFREKWIDFRHIKTKMVSETFCSAAERRPIIEKYERIMREE